MKHDEEMRPMHGMYGTLDAELEVRRTIKRAELTAFLCLLRRAIRPETVHVDKKGIIVRAVERRNEVHWPKSEGRRLVDLDLGGFPQSSSRRRYGWKSNTSKHVAPTRKGRKCRFSKSSSLKAMRKQMSQHKRERGWTEEIWRR